MKGRPTTPAPREGTPYNTAPVKGTPYNTAPREGPPCARPAAHGVALRRDAYFSESTISFFKYGTPSVIHFGAGVPFK